MHRSQEASETSLVTLLVPEGFHQNLAGNQRCFYQGQQALLRPIFLNELLYTALPPDYLRQQIQSFPDHLSADNEATTPVPFLPLQNRQMNRHVGETYQAPLPLFSQIFYKVYLTHFL